MPTLCERLVTITGPQLSVAVGSTKEYGALHVPGKAFRTTDEGWPLMTGAMVSTAIKDTWQVA